MPELPEVETTIQGLRPHVRDQHIISLTVRNPHLRWPVADDTARKLQGQRIIDIERRAKYLLFQCERGTIISHLGMSGSWRVITEATPVRTHDHLLLQLTHNTELRFHDPRRFGCFIYCTNPDEHPLITALGPEPLTEQFNTDYFYQKTRNKTAPIKTVLMHNPVVVGVGNIYAQEALFLAGIRPGKAAGRLTKKECDTLVFQVKALLQKAITQGGTTLRDFVNSDGEPGYFAQQLFVYGRGGKTCRRCQHTIKSLTQSNRTTSYCPQCQK